MRICPNCGYCECCGRGGCRRVRPWRYDPWYHNRGPYYVGDPAPWERPRIECAGVGGAVAQARNVVRA